MREAWYLLLVVEGLSLLVVVFGMRLDGGDGNPVAGIQLRVEGCLVGASCTCPHFPTNPHVANPTNFDCALLPGAAALI